MIMFKTILVGLVIAFGLIAFGGAKPVATTTSTTYESGYSTCINDSNVQFQAGMYKQQYPQLSTSQIMHTLCKDK